MDSAGTSSISGPIAMASLMGRAHVSKHRQFDDEGKCIPGKVRILERSSLRKMMRAARRGLVPSERISVIVHAQNMSVRAERHKWQRKAVAL